MTDAGNPLVVQELLDHCIRFLRDSPSDLKICALVSRRWVNGAQSLLFQKILINTSDRWLELQSILQSSPYLVQHIQTLIINPLPFSDDAFSALCNFDFTNLRQLYVYGTTPYHTPTSITSFQALLSRPSLIHIIFQLDTAPTPSFFALWDRCSPSLRHLELYFSYGPSAHYQPRENRSLPPIALESLRIMILSRVEDVADWLTHPLGPFDVANLRVLSIVNHPEDLWRALPSAFCSIKALEFTAQQSGTPFELSTLPDLEILRIQLFRGVTKQVVNTLSTAGPANRIRRLILTMARYIGADECGELDAKLADVLQVMDPPPTVELQMDAGEYEEYVLLFPRLTARNLIHWFEPTRSWFCDYVGVPAPY
ncbi:hypothetical protein DFH06DRAFT_355485 [Mycena polygramma]|nr:hypothetical protein DFH06DRAFT_355485 [Mycena polygramma]